MNASQIINWSRMKSPVAGQWSIVPGVGQVYTSQEDIDYAAELGGNPDVVLVNRTAASSRMRQYVIRDFIPQEVDMGFGKEVRDAYMSALKTAGQTIVVHNGWNTENATSFETRAMTGESFEFPERVEVQKGSVLQVRGGRDLWRVVDTEDDFQGGEFIYLKAVVEKIDEKGNLARPSAAGNAIFNAPVHGGVQVGGHQNVQNISIGGGQSVEALVAQLVEVLRTSALPDLEKEDAIEAAQRLPQLAEREQTPDVLQRAKDRLELIKSSLETGSGAVAAAAPIFEALKGYFGL